MADPNDPKKNTSSTWFSDAALKLESFYIQNNDRIHQVASIGRIWGTRVQDLTNPVGVAGRALRSVPEMVNLARSFTKEPNTVYARALLRQELPYSFIGEDIEEDFNSVNPRSDHMAGLLQGVASVLDLKTEEVTFFRNPSGEVDIFVFKVHLGEGITVGVLRRREYSIYSALYSSHPAEETQAHLLSLWEKKGIVGLNIKATSKDGTFSKGFSDSEMSRIEEGGDLVVGNEFANDYMQIAERIRRFERAGYRRNLMLLGPPGCGKTSIAQKIAREIGRFTINVESDLLGSAVLIHALTHFFSNVLLICDDFDRYQGNTQALLASLEKTGASLIVTCNTIYGFDKAAVRVGRIDEIIDVPKPDAGMRRRLFQHFHQNMDSPPPTDDQFEQIIDATDGFTPAEMREVVKCWEVLGYEDSQIEIKRLRRQSKLAEDLWYKLDWAGPKKEGSLVEAESGDSPAYTKTVSREDPLNDLSRWDDVEDDEY